MDEGDLTGQRFGNFEVLKKVLVWKSTGLCMWWMVRCLSCRKKQTTTKKELLTETVICTCGDRGWYAPHQYTRMRAAKPYRGRNRKI